MQEMHSNKDLINKTVADNIDIVTPEPGAVIFKLCQIEKERNIVYSPSQESEFVLNEYCEKRGI